MNRTLQTTLALLLPAVFHAGTAMSARANPPVLAGSSWTVTKIDGKAPIDGVPVTIEFDAEGKVTGNASCNRYGAAVTIDGGKISVGPIRATRRYGTEVSMAQERGFLALLQAAQTWEISGDDILVLRAPAGEILARRQPEDAAQLHR